MFVIETIQINEVQKYFVLHVLKLEVKDREGFS